MQWISDPMFDINFYYSFLINTSGEGVWDSFIKQGLIFPSWEYVAQGILMDIGIISVVIIFVQFLRNRDALLSKKFILNFLGLILCLWFMIGFMQIWRYFEHKELFVEAYQKEQDNWYLPKMEFYPTFKNTGFIRDYEKYEEAKILKSGRK